MPQVIRAFISLPASFQLSFTRTLSHSVLNTLFQATVAVLHAEIPGLGETIAVDVKHIYAWVKENNFRQYVTERFDPLKQPRGDPDCTLAVKRSTNQLQANGSSKEKKELLWGYGSGVGAATTPDYGDVVLAEFTQGFNEGDVTYFEPLYQRTVATLDFFPPIAPLMPRLTRGTCIKKVRCMGALLLFLSINTDIPPSLVTLMAFLAVPKPCA